MLVCGFAYLKRRKTKHFLWSLLNKLRPSGITLVPRLLWSQILVIHAQQNVVKDYMRDHKPLYQSRISRNLRCSAEVGSNIVYLPLFLYVLSSFVHNMLLKCAFFFIDTGHFIQCQAIQKCVFLRSIENQFIIDLIGYCFLSDQSIGKDNCLFLFASRLSCADSE